MPQLKHALPATNGAGGNVVVDEANLVLPCPMCTGVVYHAACGGADFRTLCSTCGQQTVEQWNPWNQPHTPSEDGGASGNSVAAENAGDERADHVPPAHAASAVRAKSKFLPFKHALLRARSLNLKGTKEWRVWCKSSKRPANIPSNPNHLYKHEGWQGYGHWLGTSNAGIKKHQQFLPFNKALLHARSLKLESWSEWWLWCKSGEREANMPSNPYTAYKHDGWQGYGHWLGTGNVASRDKQFLPFKKALLYARTLKLKSLKEWHDWAKTGARPATIPSTPHVIYKYEGWQGYGHWIGTGNVRNGSQQLLTFEKALLYARSLKLKGKTEWREWCKTGARAANMPSHPDSTYKHDGWQGYGHWLGTGNVRGGNGQQFLPFTHALLYARSLKLKGKVDWEAWCKSGARPPNVPSHPETIYKHDGWQGYGHWLGTGNAGVKKDQQFLPFDEALLHARFLKMKGVKEWKQWCKSGARPANMPSDPSKVYKHDGWQGYGHWLGTSDVRGGNGQQFLPFKHALLYARSLKLKGKVDWEAWCKSGARPANVPSKPHKTYKHDGWQGYGHWLRTGSVAPKYKQFLPFKKALQYARSLKLKGCKQWEAWRKTGERHYNIPSHPEKIYEHDGWQGYRHWLGTL